MRTPMGEVTEDRGAEGLGTEFSGPVPNRSDGRLAGSEDNCHQADKSGYEDYPTCGFNESEAPDVTAWKLARSAIEHENNLVNHRLTWFFSAHLFLMSAFVLTLVNSEKPLLRELQPALFLVIGFLGMYMCMVTNEGLDRALRAMDRVTHHYNVLRRKHKFERTPPLHLWAKPRLMNTKYVPVVTMAMWIAFEVVCAFASWPTQGTVVSDKRLIVTGIAIAFMGLLVLAYLVDAVRMSRRLKEAWNYEE
jgi:hypothetical protein